MKYVTVLQVFGLLGAIACRNGTAPEGKPLAPIASTVVAGAQSRPEAIVDDLVNVGKGLKLHIHCEGSGVPLVVLESGLGANAKFWYSDKTPIAPLVSEYTRVCVYDRAGRGLSDAAPLGHSHSQMAEELHALLKNSGQPGPYLLAGHSMGGIVSLFFLEQHPLSVAGLVLIDSSPEPPPIEQFPPALVEGFRKNIARMEGLKLETFLRGFEQLKEFDLTLGDRPLAILAAGKTPIAPGGPSVPSAEAKLYLAAQQRAQKLLTKLSTNSAFVVAHQSGHNIPHESPALVLAAVRAVVDSVRTRSKLHAKTIEFSFGL